MGNETTDTACLIVHNAISTRLSKAKTKGCLWISTFYILGTGMN
jgi:hypothetical protein